MMKVLSVVLLLGAALTVSADEQSMDCPMRQLAIDYCAKIQPFRTQAALQEMADAIVGSALQSNCTVTLPKTVAKSYPPVYKTTTPLSNTLYVDAVKGSDSNPGTMAAPFKTIMAGVAAGRSLTGAVTLNLRAGTFYQADTIMLTPDDNGLTIQAYNGEEVWISGGRLLSGLSWKEYDVHNASSTFTIEQNQNDVYGANVGTPPTPLLGKTNTWQECQALCAAQSDCTAFTWHDKDQAGYALDCVGRTDGVWSPRAQSGHVSGKRGASSNTWSADLSAMNIASIPGLRQNGGRAIRARFPNADPENGFGSTLMAKSWSKPDLPTAPVIEFNPQTPFRNNSYGFNTYQIGVKGPCDNFDPPAGYWCGNKTSGGGAFTYRVPTGMTVDSSILPNMPSGGYKNVDKAVVQTWRPAHWSSWMFQVGSFDASTQTFTFSKGGFQGARGDNNGDNFYIENVLEELDAPGEWYYDETSKTLYVYNNATGAPSSSDVFVATNTKVLFNVTGNGMSQPIKDVSFKGVGFRDTAYTYLDPHGMPSGGDWALERTGAVFVQRSEGFTIEGCIFTRVDGNAVMISAYNRGLQIVNSEFAWIGDNTIAQWGNTAGSPVYGMGPDGTNGDQPRGSIIKGNWVHEVGIWEKQSSFYFQAKSAQVTIQDNIFVNGPRAGINFNDGFGGGANITSNFLANTCRESGDHGPFNSWDRQTYLTDVPGSPTVYKLYDDINNNFIIANYNSQEAIDNDDGSCYYHTHHNFFAYSGNGMKNDFGGHSNVHHDNVYAYVGHGFGITTQDTSYPDFFYNNRVVQTKDGDYGNPYCSGTQHAVTVLYNNSIFTPTGKVTECGMSLSDWQAKSPKNDPGTTAHTYPSDDELLGWVKDMFDLS